MLQISFKVFISENSTVLISVSRHFNFVSNTWFSYSKGSFSLEIRSLSSWSLLINSSSKLCISQHSSSIFSQVIFTGYLNCSDITWFYISLNSVSIKGIAMYEMSNVL